MGDLKRRFSEIIRKYEEAYPELPDEEVRQKFVEFIEEARDDQLEDLLQEPYSFYIRSSVNVEVKKEVEATLVETVPERSRKIKEKAEEIREKREEE